jgi:tRNA U55 pseudouridine synthase TruB
VLDDIPALVLNETEARRIRQGQKIQLNSLEFKYKFELKHPNYQDFEKIYAIRNNNIVALIKIDNGIVKPSRIINF